MLHQADSTTDLSKCIQDYLRKSPEVRPFPAAVARLTVACQDPNASSRHFESIIQCDPSLSVRLLRIANSPLFCPSNEVKSVAHAVSLLGLRRLKALAMSVAGAAMFSSGDAAHAQRQRLWNHSVACAVVASALAKRSRYVDPDDAFLAGIFHDVGKLLFYDVVPDAYAEIEARCSGSGAYLVSEEERLLGTTHEDVGLASTTSWSLPDEIKAGVGWHHRPEHATVCPELAQLIGAADTIVKIWGLGADPIEAAYPICLSAYDLTEGQLEGLRDQVRQEFDQTVALSMV